MAVYEFECEACGHRFEVTAPITAHPQLKERPPACPACAKTRTRQLVSLFKCASPKAF
jgi:putative FmdB family regulatory protein